MIPKNNSFGLTDNNTNKIYKGNIDNTLKQNANRIYKVPSNASAILIIRETTQRFLDEQKIEYILKGLINHE